jgi:hypothetical protein
MATKSYDNPSTRHPSYTYHNATVNLCYDAFYGDIRNPKYVKPLSEQSESEYEAFITRPFYLNATERTVQSLIGTMMRNPMQISGPEPVVNGNLNFEALVQDQIMDIALGGRIAITVDVYEDGTPYITYYPSQNIINWGEDFIVLETTKQVTNPKNRFELVEVTYWKEIFIDEEGYHAARTWELIDNRYIPSEAVRLIVRGQPVEGLQVFWVTPYDNTALIYNPPVKSVAELNIAHFRLSCDHYNGLHFLAVPTLFAHGPLQPDSNGNTTQKIVLGSTSSAPHFEAGGGLAFAEFGGAGLNSLHEEKNRVEELMNQYGARLVSPKAGVESAEAVNLRAVAETSILITLTNALENALNGALELYSVAVGTQVNVELNTNFIDTSSDNSSQL